MKMLANPSRVLGSALAVLALPLAGQAQIPETPQPSRDKIKPYALNFSLAQRWRDNSATPHEEDTTLTWGVDYRFPGNMFRAGLFAGFTPQTRTRSVTLSISYKLFEWGHRR